MRETSRTSFSVLAKAVTTLAIRISCSELVEEWGYQKTHPEDRWRNPGTWEDSEAQSILQRAQGCVEGLFLVLDEISPVELDRLVTSPIGEVKETLSALLDKIEEGHVPQGLVDRVHNFTRLLTISSLLPEEDNCKTNSPSMETFERWSRFDPQRLVNFLQKQEGSPVHLGLAAEVAGTLDLPEVRGVLLSLLDHESPFVREGAIYGLESMAQDTGVRQRLMSLLKDDRSVAVRAAATDVLE